MVLLIKSSRTSKVVRAAAAVLLVGALVGGALAACRPPSRGQYPLRHAFSLVPGLPGAGRRPTSCYAVGGRNYLCRIVEGYEPGGDHRDFRFRTSEALRKGTHPKYGAMVVRRNGSSYEGCRVINGRFWECDHRVSKLVSRHHYKSTKRFVLRVFWRWASYTANQASCAYGATALWTRPNPGKFFAALNGCRNGPL